MDIYSKFLKEGILYECNRCDLHKCNIKENFNVLYLNINRLVSERRREYFNYYLNSLKFIPDAIVLVETFFTSTNNALKVKNYNGYHSFRKRIGGGVSIYILKTHKSILLNQYEVDENEKILVKLLDFKFKIAGVYRPPHTDLSKFCDYWKIPWKIIKNGLLWRLQY
jgi:hypothetical protein